MSTANELDLTGNYHGKCHGWIETVAGQPFDVISPQDDAIDIDVIAHALSNLCRFNGHCKSFYSVAEHSCYVADWLAQNHGGIAELPLIGLLHDGSEAYVGDVVRPLKPALAEYAAIEARIQGCIYRRFGVLGASHEHSAILKAADNTVLRAEAEQLMASGGLDWNFGGVAAAPIEVIGWAPQVAREQFLARFHQYAI